MLQKMREGVQGWIAWFIIGILVLSLLLWGISSYFHGGQAAKNDAATVNSTTISVNDINQMYARVAMQNNAGPLSSAQQQRLRENILKQLIDFHVMVDGAKQLKFTASQAQVDALITQNPNFQVNGQFSAEQFRALLSRMSLTSEQFTQNIQHQLVLNQLQQALFNTTFILPNNVTQKMQLLQQKRSFRYANLDKRQLRSPVNVSEADIQSYYNSHKQQYLTPEKARIEYLLLSVDALAKQVKPSNKQLENYYQTHINDYTNAPRWHLAHILIRETPQTTKAAEEKVNAVKAALKANKPFAEIAKQYSDDPISARKGGDMGWNELSAWNQSLAGGTTAISNQLLNMKTGDTSAAIKTPSGYSFIKVLGKQDKKVKPYTDVASVIKQAYISQTAQAKFTQLKNQIADLVAQTPDSLKPIAEQLKLNTKQTGWFNKIDTSVNDNSKAKTIAQEVAINNAAFDEDNLNGDNSDVIDIAPGKAAVIRVLAHQKAATQPLKDVRNSIVTTLTQDKQQQALTKLGQKIIAELNAKPTDYQKLAKQYKLTWKNVNLVQRSDRKIDSAIIEQAFSLPRPTAKTPSNGGFNHDNDYVILSVTKLEDSTKDTNNTQQSALYKRELNNGYAGLLLQETQDYFHKTAKIKVYSHNGEK